MKKVDSSTTQGAERFLFPASGTKEVKKACVKLWTDTRAFVSLLTDGPAREAPELYLPASFLGQRACEIGHCFHKEE